MQLNEAQKKAVCHENGPMLVLAGPGSGKTRVITERIRYLVNDRKIDPNSIMVVTFTRAAAAEMKNRFQTSCGRTGVLFGTFHSIFFYILKNAYGYSSSDIVGEDEMASFIFNQLSANNTLTNIQKYTVPDIISEISRVKSENYNIDDYYTMLCPADLFRKIFKQYDKWLKENRKIDFDDMMIYTYDLFSKRKDILSLWQKRFRYILIDEFQDINRLQYDILKMLVIPENNLFAVGDDDQAIYSFRGSNPLFMLQFDKDFPNTKKVLLPVNYRCTGNIVNASTLLIRNNKNRFDKQLYAHANAGEKVEIRGFETLKDQNAYVVDALKKIKENGKAYNSAAILYRTNYQAQAVLCSLYENNIPVRLKDGVPDIYEHWIAKDIFAYIMLAQGKRDRDLFVRIANKPKRYIAKDSLYDRYINFNELEKIYEEKPWMCDRIVQMEADIKALGKMNPERALTYIYKVIGYGEYIDLYADEHKISADELKEVYEQIRYYASDYRSYDEWFDGINEFRNRTYAKIQDTDAVSLMTFHGSKGLEFDNVFIIDANEGVIPYAMAVNPEAIEEERRMFYVAMTRAKRKLYLLYSKNRYNRECKPSFFLDEISHHNPSSHSILLLP